MSADVIEVCGVSKIYGEGETRMKALDSVDLKIHRGDFAAIVGPSGSGKTTLLNIISGLDRPTEGTVILDGKMISAMTGNELSDYRRDQIGFVFQSYNLIPVLSVSENIEYVMLLQKISSQERRQRVQAILNEVGLTGKENHKPSQLSGGQQQRVAVARAIVSRPTIILADEPTANLDSKTGESLLNLMRGLNLKHQMTFLFSTHDKMIMDRAKRLITLKDGKIECDEIRS